MTKKQYGTANVSIGTVKKSIAAIASRCFSGTSATASPDLHLSGLAGSIATLLYEISKPSLGSSS
jgi:hypothetical protein